MRNTGLIAAVLSVLSIVLPGCSRQVVEADNPSTVSAAAYEQTFKAAVDVLRDYGFTIDRLDFRFGEITTRPLDSPNLFEVWRPHNTSGRQAVESTLASEQRRVRVVFTRPEAEGKQLEGADYMLGVQVVMERMQVPTRRMAGSAKRNVFSNLSAPPRELMDKGVRGNYWEEVGRDPLLEARLIRQITDRVN